MASDPVLQAFNLSKRFKSRWAVHELNLTVPRGEVFGFLGPNGAGKSTTIRMFLTLITPTSGRVELFGKPLHRHRAEILARVGGLVERADFYLYLTARRNLEIIAGLIGSTSSKKIDAVLDIVGLLDRAGDKVKTYSHGMKQRLGIGQALLGDPEFIILDEPTSGLDPIGIKEVRELIRQLSTEQSITVFLSSHLLSEIEQTATSMAIINAGRLVVQGKVKELLEEREGIVRIDARPKEQVLQDHQRAPAGIGGDKYRGNRGGDDAFLERPAAHTAPGGRRSGGAGVDPTPVAGGVLPFADRAVGRTAKGFHVKGILGNEILKTFLRWRSYIGFIAILVVVPLVEIGLKVEGGSIVNAMTRTLAPDFLLVGNLFNAYFVTLFIMNGLWVHIPFLISLVAGDQLAGEASGGTFRLLLTRPPSRSHILFCKYRCHAPLHCAAGDRFLPLLASAWELLSSAREISLFPGKGLTIIAAGGGPLGASASRFCSPSGACGASPRSRSSSRRWWKTPSARSSGRWR